MPVKNGEAYRDRIDRGRAEIWLKGERLNVPVSEHPAFCGLVNTQSSMYDMQEDAAFKRKMTYLSPSTGDPVGLSFLQPRTKKDLVRRRTMMSMWADRHFGFLGRSPDYMNTALMAFFAAADLLTQQDPQYAENMKQYYVYCRENDITLSHAFVQPYASRLHSFFKEDADILAAKVLEHNRDGMVVSGAFLINTQGATADEILVFPSPIPYPSTDANPYSFMFAVPNHLPGIRFICRESHVPGSSTFDYPLSSRFEEMDTMVIFDRVPVPADRIFLYGNEALASRYVAESHFHTHVSHHILCRYIAKTELFLGTASHLGQALGLEANSSYVEKMSIIITALETLKALLLTAEWKARRDKWGSMLPDVKPLLTANVYFPSVYPSMVEIIQLLGSSGIMMIPSKGDLDSAIGADLGKYLKGEDRNAAGYVALCRLAWELSASSFGGRQLQYERFFFGNPQRVRDRLYNGYKEIEEDCRRKVTRFLNGSLL